MEVRKLVYGDHVDLREIRQTYPAFLGHPGKEYESIREYRVSVGRESGEYQESMGRVWESNCLASMGRELGEYPESIRRVFHRLSEGSLEGGGATQEGPIKLPAVFPSKLPAAARSRFVLQQAPRTPRTPPERPGDNRSFSPPFVWGKGL